MFILIKKIRIIYGGTRIHVRNYCLFGKLGKQYNQFFITCFLLLMGSVFVRSGGIMEYASSKW